MVAVAQEHGLGKCDVLKEVYDSFTCLCSLYENVQNLIQIINPDSNLQMKK